MARSAPMGGKGGGQSVPYQPAGFGQNQQFSGGFGMGTGGFSQPQFGQPPQFGGGFGGGFGMQQQPPNQLVGINANPPVMDQRVRDRRARDPFERSPNLLNSRLGVAMPEMGPRATTGQEQLDAMRRRQQQLGSAGFGGLGDFLKGGFAPDRRPFRPPEGGAGGYVPREGIEAGRITDMRYRAPGRVLPPGRFQPFPQPGGRPMPPQLPHFNYNRLLQPMPMPDGPSTGYGNFPPRRMPGYGNFPPRLPPRFQQPRPQPMPRYGNISPAPMPGYGGFPVPMPMPRYQPALPSRLGSPTMYQGRGFTPNYGVPRSMIPPQEYQLFDQGGLGGFF